MYEILRSYLSQLPDEFRQSNPEDFSATHMSLLSLSHSLHNLSLISKNFQEVEYTPDFISKLDLTNKQSMFNEAVYLHKMLSHFILTNAPKDTNE